MFIFKITHYFKTTITQKNNSLRIIFNIFYSSIFYYITKNALCNHTVHNKFIWRRHPDLNWGIKVLQTSALPLGYAAVWSGKRGSNSRPSPWQGDALPLSYFRMIWSGKRGSNSRPSPWQGDALPLSYSRIVLLL